MEFVHNEITLKGNKNSISNLKSFLDKYTYNNKTEDGIGEYVDFNQKINNIYNKTVLDGTQNNESNLVWFYFTWCEAGSDFYGKVFENDILYFRTSCNSSLNTIILISKIFSDIEFELAWESMDIMNEYIGYAKIKEGGIFNCIEGTPEWYWNRLEASCENEKVDFPF